MSHHIMHKFEFTYMLSVELHQAMLTLLRNNATNSEQLVQHFSVGHWRCHWSANVLACLGCILWNNKQKLPIQNTDIDCIKSFYVKISPWCEKCVFQLCSWNYKKWSMAILTNPKPTTCIYCMRIRDRGSSWYIRGVDPTMGRLAHISFLYY